MLQSLVGVNSPSARWEEICMILAILFLQLLMKMSSVNGRMLMIMKFCADNSPLQTSCVEQSTVTYDVRILSTAHLYKDVWTVVPSVLWQEHGLLWFPAPNHIPTVFKHRLGKLSNTYFKIWKYEFFNRCFTLLMYYKHQPSITLACFYVYKFHWQTMSQWIYSHCN